MPIWLFKRRRRGNSTNAHDADTEKRPLDGTAKSLQQPTHATSPPLSPTDAPATLPRRSSRRASRRARRRASQQYDTAVDPRSPASETRLDSANKENVPPPGYVGSREDITALPITQRLEQSPHLRPADLARPQIPYNFRPHSMSQTSVHGQDTLSKLSKSQTLRSKRSTTDGTPSRKFSARSKRREDPVREEEIRAMTAPIPIPKRHGEGLLRRDSKKVRGLSGDSHVSLPPEGSIHSSMSGVIEQRGWEFGSLAVFSPRPAVRLSGLPQYVSNSLPPSSSGLLYRIESLRDKEKAPATQESQSRRKRRTVGENADDLDASDIRTIMERDAKRREKRQLERQEQLDRKLKAKALRDRADSGKKRTASEERRRVEQAKARAGEQLQARGILTPPSDVHPALRTSAEASPLPSPVPVGLGIDEQAALEESVEQGQNKEMKGEEAPENPFVDAPEESSPSPPEDDAADHTATIPEEEPFLGTAQAIRMSQANTPPLSPVYSNRITSSTSHLAEAIRQESMSQQSMADLPLPPRLPVERRSSDPPKEKRAGTWATLFRRGGTFRRSVVESKEPTESSFSNTSRESMRNQPLPAHLVGNDVRSGANRRPSGTPARTQSKFREDLPEMPASPPDSRTQSPDVTTAAAAAAAARRTGGISAQPVDISGKSQDAEGDVVMGGRNDTPISPMRGHSAMAGSMASIGSEGSWLASGSMKRQSTQSALSKSLVQRKAEFVGSYEELGVDKDAEYLNRNISSRGRSNVNSPTLGASPDEESEGESPPVPSQGEPMTVHGSVRRKPTLVQRDPRLKSREGLVQEYAAQEGIETPYEASLHTGDESEDYEPESPHPQIARATSVKTGNRHSRQISAGSARLLDVPAKRPSMDISRENTPSPRPTVSRAQTNE